MAGPSPQTPADPARALCPPFERLPPPAHWKPPLCDLAATEREISTRARLPEPVPNSVVVFSVFPDPVPGDAVAFSVLPEPARTSVVVLSVFPDPVPGEAVAFSVLRAPTPPAVDARPEPPPDVAPEVAALEEPINWRPPVVPVPQRERTSPAPRRPTEPEPVASIRPRRWLVGLVGFVAGALSVVAVRAVVDRGDEDDAGLAAPPQSAVSQSSISGDATSVAGQPAAPATTVAASDAPAVSVAGPVVPATEAPEISASDTVVTTPAATTVLVPTPANSAPAAGATQFQGFGNFVVNLIGYDLSRKVMVVTHNGVARFELSTLDQDLNQLALVESVVGAVSGTYPLGFEGDATPSYLRIDADGVWAIDIKPVEDVRLWPAGSIAGTGADVLRYEGGASVLDYTSSGTSNFIVQYHRNPGFDLLVNEIGPISGATTMQAGPGVVVVDAEGDWALSATPS